VVRLTTIAAILLASIASTAEGFRIGVTLHPYYSFTANIVQDQAEVVPIIESGFNVHAYEPQPGDIQRAQRIDAIVVNDIGHDEWAFELLRAAEQEANIPVIYANKDVTLSPVSGRLDSERVINSHTFISISASLPQIFTIAEELGRIDPDNAKFYRDNARAYAARLRRMKARYLSRLADVSLEDFRCATVHSGYDYLFHELGLTVSAIIEPHHGVQPTASQLRDTIDRINELEVDVVFSEADYPEAVLNTIQQATGVPLVSLSHMTSDDFTADAFERKMRENLEAVTSAIIDVQRGKGRAYVRGE